MYIASMTPFSSAVSSGGTPGRACGPAQPQLRRFSISGHHLGLVVPSRPGRELDDLHVGAVIAVHPEHQLDALFSWMPTSRS